MAVPTRCRQCAYALPLDNLPDCPRCGGDPQAAIPIPDTPAPKRLPAYPPRLYQRLWQVQPGLYAELLIAEGSRQQPDIIITDNLGWADAYRPYAGID